MRVFVVATAVLLAGCAEPALTLEDGTGAPRPEITNPTGAPDTGLPETVARPEDSLGAPAPGGVADAVDEGRVACRADDAHGWHKALNEAHNVGTMTYQGREDGEAVRIRLAIDEHADKMYLKGADIEVVSHGRFVAFLGDEPFITRQDGISFTQEFIGWEDEEAADTDPFAIPTSWFDSRCDRFRGLDVFVLEYTENGLGERWYFNAATSDFVHAEHENRRTDTDVALTFSPLPEIPGLPTAPKLPARFYLELLSERGDDEEYVMKYAVAPDSNTVTYQELEFVFYDESDEEIGRIDARPGERERDFAAVKVRDVNLGGVADPGDVWTITLGPEAYSWDLIDEWARDIAYIEFVEGVEEVDEDVIVPARETYVPSSSETIARTFEWEFGGSEWTWDLELPEDLHDYYQDREIIRTSDGVAFDVYVTDPLDDEWIQALANRLQEAGQEEGWDDDEVLSFALAFVQSLPYTEDKVTSGYDEYPRFPIQTLVANGGDCEDTSILFASIALAMGYDVILVSPPGHIAVGVAAEDDGLRGGYRHDGRFYAFAETTGDGFGFGDIPDAYVGARAAIYELTPKAVAALDWSYGDEPEPGYWNIVITVENTGSASIESAELWGGIETGGDRFHDSDSCRFARISPGETVTCTMWLELPTYDDSVRFVAVGHGDPGIYVRSESTWT